MLLPDEIGIVSELRSHVAKPREVDSDHEIIIKMSLVEASKLLGIIERLSGEQRDPSEPDTVEW